MSDFTKCYVRETANRDIEPFNVTIKWSINDVNIKVMRMFYYYKDNATSKTFTTEF